MEVEVNIAGVLTGITASAIFASVVWVIKQKLWPMYLSATYKGTKIDGDWDVFYEGKDEPSAVVTFTQKGTELRGHSVVSKNRNGDTVDRKYCYRGTFLNRSVILTFEDKKIH
ncbi:hypothetical protein ACN5YO_004641 [Vibrio parahaemolyticus]